jgi:hypothetical protein
MPLVTPIRIALRPTANVMLPHQSIRPGCRSPLSRSDRYAHTVPITPTGTLTQNTARQSIAARTPPATSPMNWPAMAATWLMPRAKPRWSTGNASVRIAAEFAVSIEPPSACTTRQPISHCAPCAPMNGSNDSRIDAAVKTTKPPL